MKERTFKAAIANVPEITRLINEWLKSLGCPMKALIQIDVAVDELFSNIAKYAYPPNTGDATIRLDFDPETRMATITFIDSGVAYNPLEWPDPDVTLTAQQRGIGGLGIFLVKKSMDGMEYAREGGFNHLTIRKRI